MRSPVLTKPFRPFLLLVAMALSAGLLAACGGDDDEAASLDVNTLLEQTFTGEKKVDSGVFALNLEVDARGVPNMTGPVTLKLGGPFQSEGDAKLPKFDLDFSFSGAGQNISAGATSTGEKGFVSFQSSDYEISDQVFNQFREGYEQAQKDARDKQKTPSLATLGIDPRKWLTNPKNEGEAKVGDDDTIKITGGVDVPKLLDDVNRALQQASALNLQGAPAPTELTPAQKREVAEAVKDLKVEIYTGEEDKILRRMVVRLGLQPTEKTDDFESAGIVFDLSITDLNEDQDIDEPEDPKPFEELAGQLGQLGLGGLGGSAGSGSGGSSGSGGGASEDALDKYAECIRKAGNDTAEAQKCADLLTP
jgi:uncharacterized membrane protein YgcG